MVEDVWLVGLCIYLAQLALPCFCKHVTCNIAKITIPIFAFHKGSATTTINPSTATSAFTLPLPLVGREEGFAAAKAIKSSFVVFSICTGIQDRWEKATLRGGSSLPDNN